MGKARLSFDSQSVAGWYIPFCNHLIDCLHKENHTPVKFAFLGPTSQIKGNTFNERNPNSSPASNSVALLEARFPASVSPRKISSSPYLFQSYAIHFTRGSLLGDSTYLFLFSISQLTNIKCVVMPRVNNHVPVFAYNITNCYSLSLAAFLTFFLC